LSDPAVLAAEVLHSTECSPSSSTWFDLLSRVGREPIGHLVQFRSVRFTAQVGESSSADKVNSDTGVDLHFQTSIPMRTSRGSDLVSEMM